MYWDLREPSNLTIWEGLFNYAYDIEVSQLLGNLKAQGVFLDHLSRLDELKGSEIAKIEKAV
jgi:hypothetical protein